MKKTLMSVGVIVIFIAIVYMVVSKGDRKDISNNIQNDNTVNDTTITKGDIASVLSGNIWKWQGSIMSDDSTVTPAKADAFTLTFTKEGQVSGTTDCNSFSGSYTLGQDGTITFGAMAGTQMFCEGSQEGVFTGELANVDRIFFDEAGNLILLLKLDSGAIIFKK